MLLRVQVGKLASEVGFRMLALLTLRPDPYGFHCSVLPVTVFVRILQTALSFKTQYKQILSSPSCWDIACV